MQCNKSVNLYLYVYVSVLINNFVVTMLFLFCFKRTNSAMCDVKPEQHQAQVVDE